MRALPSIPLRRLVAVSSQPAEPGGRLLPPPDGEFWKVGWHDEFDDDKPTDGCITPQGNGPRFEISSPGMGTTLQRPKR
jgi:hypothetical protein